MRNKSPKERIILCSKTDPSTGCWNWQQAFRRGYGTMSVKNQSKYAHRVSYEQFVGPISQGSLICHTCDNTKCVNPGHLYLGDAKTNAQDMQKRGRSAIVRYPDKYVKRGEDHRSAKLTEEQVQKISLMYKPYDRSFGAAALAIRFRVSQKSISQLVNKKTWKHL